MIKSIIIRFLKGGIASAVSAMGVVSIHQPTVWGDFHTVLSSLALAGAFGFITGLLLALEKWANWTE